MSNLFETWTNQDVSDLVAAYPLAMIISKGSDFATTLMPMLLDVDAQGSPVSLTGHFPRASAHFAQLSEQPHALFLFQGPHAYVSPTIIRKKSWAPTWNFAVVRIVANVQFDEGLTDEALDRVSAHMEAGEKNPWTRAELGVRDEQLRKAVIGFRAPIDSLTARFKLGQDESPESLADIAENIDNAPLIAWMRRFNQTRM